MRNKSRNHSKIENLAILGPLASIMRRSATGTPTKPTTPLRRRPLSLSFSPDEDDKDDSNNDNGSNPRRGGIQVDRGMSRRSVWGYFLMFSLTVLFIARQHFSLGQDGPTFQLFGQPRPENSKINGRNSNSDQRHNSNNINNRINNNNNDRINSGEASTSITPFDAEESNKGFLLPHKLCRFILRLNPLKHILKTLSGMKYFLKTIIRPNSQTKTPNNHSSYSYSIIPPDRVKAYQSHLRHSIPSFSALCKSARMDCSSPLILSNYLSVMNNPTPPKFLTVYPSRLCGGRDGGRDRNGGGCGGEVAFENTLRWRKDYKPWEGGSGRWV